MMVRYEVAIIRKFSTIYVVEAANADEAEDVAWREHKETGGGGPCHHCADGVGEEEEPEAVVVGSLGREEAAQ